MTDPASLQERLAGLSKEQRALLFEQLRKRKEGAGKPPQRIPRRPPGLDPVPASFAQERLWFIERLTPGNAAYNMPMALRIEGEVAPAVLEAVLGEVVRRHEAVRTTFRESGGQPVQVIAAPGRWSLPLADLSALPADRRETEARRLAVKDALRPFDLETGPLLRATLLRLGPAAHALLLNMHHIVSDGWSMGVLVHEITALYGAAVSGGLSPLRELAVQYADFAVWQRGWLQGEALERQMVYWRERLAGVPVSLDLPADRPRPATATYRGARLSLTFGHELARGLNQLARRHESSLYMVILAGFQALLGRLTGQEDFAVGSPIANRTRAEIEPLIGFFVNTLVMRGDLRGEPSFRELLSRVRNSTLDAYAHQDLPFERLVEELRPERHLSLNPLFQAVCALQNAPLGRMDLPGLSISPLEQEAATAQFDLELNVWEREDSLLVFFAYSAELFDPATVRRLAGSLETLLRGALADPDRPIPELPLLAEGERHQLLLEWNDTSRTGEPAGVLERFAAQVARTPGALALEAGGERLTYAGLDRRSNRLARRLRGLGVGPGVVVGLLAERSTAMVTGMLAVWKAGGVYVPLDPGLPKARLDYLLEDSRAALVLDGPGLAEVEEDDLPPAGAPRPADLAYRIYTSGTTGLPKAVEVEHRQLASTLSAAQEAFGFGPGDRMPAIASFSFDIFLFEVFGPLLAGGACALLPLRPTLDMERLLQELESATLLHAVPAVMRQVVDAARSRGIAAPALRGLFTGGDAVPADLLADLRAAFPQARTWVLYGPTEAAIVCTYWPVPSEGPVRSLLGRPFVGAEIRVCDRRGLPVPIGVPGEIWIGGSGVARGYWRREELTAEKFVELEGRRFYRSGDLARRLPDGTLEFLGRSDQQVKVRGFRIELGEVEAALLRQPGVSEAVALARDEESGKRLVAYVVPQEAEDDTAPLAEHVSRWRALYDETYGQGAEEADAAFNLQGWNSSYTGEPIPEIEMREWVEGTVDRLLALPHARVLEVGCGTGLLTFRVAPHADRYVGTDFSPVALDLVRREAARRGLSQVSLERRTADDWTGVEPGSFDLVVINSVVQYFPGVGYLLRVLEGAARAVRPGGAVFVGDVRSLPLLEALHLSVELFRADDSMPVAGLRRRVRRRVADEEELLLAPAFFHALARRLPVRAEVLPKAGRNLNELTRFRYDAVLHAGPLLGTAGVLAGLLPDPGLLQARLAPELAALDLLAGAGQDLETVGDLRRAVAERASQGFDPGRLGYGEPPAPPGDLPWRAFANDPLRGERARALVPELRRALQSELPDYMVPAAFVVLDSLPLTPHGKVDRAALPEPDAARSGPGSTPPRNPLERDLAAIWRELLGVEDLGVEDNFFELGGHSLLATQLVSRVRDAFGVELPLRLLFEEPTLGGLASAVQSATAAEAMAAIPRGIAGQGPVPASFAQERLWFLDRLEPGRSPYNIPLALGIRGTLDPALLAAVLGEVVRRHEALRTTFAERDGRPVQVVAPPGRWSLPVADLSGLPAARAEAEARRLAVEEESRPFDLRRGPLLRAALLRLGGAAHALLLTMHHIVSDGWSMGVLVREVAALYGVALAGRPSPLPELPLQYPDFAVWQRRWLEGGELERQLAYWRGKLAGVPASLDLPADRPRPAVPSYAGARRRLSLGADLARDLHRLARREGGTLFMVLLAGFQTLLRRLTGEEDVPVGSPIANRNRAEIEPLIGFFVNTLVLRGDLAGDPAFRELLARARRTTLEAYAHQDLPFERLVGELNPERSFDRTPLFQVMFALQNAPETAADLPGLRFEPMPLELTSTAFDLTLSLREGGDDLYGDLDYSTELFHAATISRWIGHFRNLLAAAVADPERRLSEIPLLSGAERAQILGEWSGAPWPADGELLLHRLVLAHAAVRPDALAVVGATGGSLTFGELAARAGGLARRLRQAGVGPEASVALVAGRSPELIVGMLAVLAAGGAYVPLDPALPAERLAWLLEDSGAAALLTDEDTLRSGALPETGVPVLLLGTEEADAEEAGRWPDPDPAGAAYVIYTSGSTGRPKGVVVSHASASSYARTMGVLAGLGPGDRGLFFGALGFDITIDDIWCPLAAGAAVVVRSEEMAGSVHRFLAEVERLGVTVTFLPTPFWHELAAGLESTGERLPAHLRRIAAGGEAMQPGRLASWLRGGHPAPFNQYGPTETTVVATVAGLAGWREGEPLPIGRPFGGVRTWVVDWDGQPAPAGVWGELLIGGPGVARGYLGRPDLTAERFVPDAWSGEAGARVYRTGDRARYLPDGAVEFGGRIDRQVKVRGFRIEPGEIEAALAAHPGVKEAVVVARPGPGGESSLLACVVPGEGAAPAAAELRSFLAGQLPEPMIPAAFVVLPALPLSPNGKVDRQALARLAPDRQTAADSGTPPGTPVEKAMAAVWRDVLEIGRVSLEDDFFELGGHSLLATQLVSRVRAAFGVELPLRRLFEDPTLGGLAAAVAAETAGLEAGAEVPRRPAGLDTVAASFAQERLWFLDRLEPGQPTYNIPLALRLRGEVSPALLAAVLGEVVRRHEALRTTFQERAGQPVQVVAPPGGWVLPVIDLAGLPAAAGEAEALRLAPEQAARPFDLERGPLLRATLLRLGEAGDVLNLAMHHIVSDGWSMGVLVREVTTLYGAALAGEPSPLPELPLQYPDFALWQRRWLEAGEQERQLAYWRGQLAGVPDSLDLPADYPRPAVPTRRAGQRIFHLGADLARDLHRLARQEGATLFMVLLAGFQTLLRRLTGQEDVPVGSPIANRNRAEIEPLIGFFVNTLVLRGDLAGDPAFRELLARVRRITLEAYAHQDLPFERLVGELNPERSLDRTPLFQVMFALQNAPLGAVDLPGLSLEPLALEPPSAQFDLTLDLREHGDDLAVDLEYDADLFHPATAARLADAFRTLIASLAADPERRLSEAPLLSAAERAQVLREWNDVPWERGGEPLLHRLVQAQAAATPEALAVLCAAGGSLTYGELAARAGRLAGRLRRAGVGPEVRVGVAAGRSPDLVVGMLAVLAAGGAYVPLDPELPAERRDWMVEDSGAVLLLADEPVAAARVPVLLVESAGGEDPSAPGLWADVHPEAAAYVIYTSGSTGLPKGVVVSHRSAAVHVRNMVALCGLGPGDRELQFGALGFDATVDEIWCPLVCGAAVVFRSEEMAGSVHHLLQEMARLEVTVPSLPTAFWHELAAALEQTGERLPATVRLFTVGGEAVQPGRLAPWLRDGHAPVLNLYGPTETTVEATAALLSDWREGEPVPIGRPFGGARVFVVDPSLLQPAPAGVWGELLIGGPSVARGYLGRPDLTAERFLPDAWSGEAGARAYRTGDRTRFLPDGSLAFGGRIDRQVKVRGFRVEPGEIEAALAAYPGLKDAAVVPRRGPGGEISLAAFAVPADAAAPPTAAELRAFLTGRLSGPMIPAAFVILPALPLNTNDKVDYGALARLAPEREAAPGSGTPPGTPAEVAMAALWREILDLQDVSVEDNFFELGGHSLLATRIVSRIREVSGVELPLRTLFERPTLGELAAAVAEREAAEAPAPPLERVRQRETTNRIPRRAPEGGPVPASLAQERLWFLDRLLPGTAAFNMPSPVLLRGPLDPEALDRAFREVRRRQGSLRTRFEERDGAPVQVVDPPEGWRLPRIDLDGLPASRAEAERLALEDAARPFDLERGPLFRPFLVRLSQQEHMLLLTCHHIVTDGWSTTVLLGELTAHYAAFAAGAAPPLPEPPLQYTDFALWQRERLAGPRLEAQIAYWRERLAGAPPLLDLPLDHPRPAVQTYAAGQVFLRLPAELAAALKALCVAESASLYMGLLAALALLLHRWSGQEEVVIGSPVAGRDRGETEGLIGFFLNNLPMRMDLTGRPAYRELLRRARHTALEAYANQDVPFERMLQELRLERETSYTPVFQVFLNMLNLPPLGGGRLPGGLAIEYLALGHVESKYDFTIYAAEAGEEIALTLVYNLDLFGQERMEELLRQLQSLLEQAARDPELPAGAVSLLTPAAAAVLPDPAAPLDAGWNGAVHELFFARARRHPERAAVVDPQGSWTYGELADAAGRLAAYLRAAGLERGDRVAVWAHRSAPVAWAVLGTLAAGGAFVMLDPAYPAARLAEILRLASPRAWLAVAAAGAPPREVEELLAGWEADGRLLRRAVLPGGGPPGAAGLLSSLPPAGEPAAAGPGDLAFVAFTSGSTGVPKGILGRHGPLSHFLPWQYERFGLTPEDRYSLLSGLAHDPLQRDLFTALCTGASLHAPDPAEMFVPGRLAAWAARQGITVAHLTPALGQLLTEPPGDGAGPLSIPSLRYVFLVGDVLTRLDVDRIRRLAPGVACINLYGSTETQRAVSYHVADPAAGAAGQRARQVLPLGRGMADVQVLVVNAAGLLAGVGEVGEIWMRSPHLAAGYLGDEELTRDRFRANPFTGLEADRVYRTGDLGRYLPDGEAAFAGRADQQLKIRGFRIEPGEIEAAIGRLEGVRESVVVARGDGGERYLAAYVVPEPGAVPGTAGRLRPFLASRLPDYMVPAVFVELAALPLTPNGKVDRRALPEPPRQGPETGAEPRTPMEQALAGIWAGLLRRERVGLRDNFFDLGGHSLLATQMVARVRGALGVELPLRDLFDHPTLAGLAGRIEAVWRARETGLPEPPPLRRVPRERPLPLSFAQERLWFLAQLAPGSAAYDMPAAVRLTGALDRGALAATLSEIRRRHEALRTTFEMAGGEPVQAIHPAAPLPLPLIDLAALPEPARAGEARRLAEEQARTPYDLARGPLVRASLLRLAADEHVVLWNTHHIVSDAWSVGAVLVGELGALYTAFVQGRPSPLPELPVQYADYAAWQRDWLRGPALDEQLGYWRRRLAGADPLDLPTDRPRPPVPSGRGASRFFRLPAPATDALRRLAQGRGATLFMALQAGFAALLHLYTGRTDVVAGTPVANRSRAELEGLIGFFVNTLVLRLELGGDPGLAALTDRAREAALGAYAHQDLPFEKLVDELGLPRDPFRPPLLRVVLQLRNIPVGEGGLALPGLTLAPFGIEVETAKFDLVVNFGEGPDALHGEVRYDADLFDPATAERLAGHLGSLLETWAEDPGRRLSGLSVLSASESHQLLVEPNEGPAFPVRRPRCLHTVFEERVDRAPDAVAVSDGRERLTYRELDERANRLARRLRAQGAGPGTRVALQLERSAGLAAAILAVLKTGAAYVPLDPAYPAERLAFTLQDSGAGLLVTETDAPGESPDRLAVTADPALPAYVIYTSGSTGHPKGVVVTHANVDSLFAATEPWFGFSPDDVWTLFHSYAFDFSVWELWGALLYGGRLVVVPYWESRDPEAFYDLLIAERVTVLSQTPSAFRQLLWAGEGRPADLALRYVVFGGEALEPASLAPWFERHGDERPRLINMYGITETTVHVTYRRIRREDTASAVGRPIPDLAVHLLDPSLRPAPLGVPGEIHVGGAGLAQGYLNRPELTAERFVPDPFGEPGSRLYRSGDLARRLPDGDLEYLGRIDHQVKIRGFRIELGEIEAALAAHPAVREAVVLAREDRRGGERRLVAYVVPAPGRTPEAAVLRDSLADRLPDHMLPSAFVVLDALPLTANGKVDRRALPEPGETAAAPSHVPPRTDLERFLAGQFRDVLGLGREVGVHDDFFALGGTSITGAVFIHRLQEALGEIVHVVTIFDHPTVASLADYVRERHAGADAATPAGPEEIAEMRRLIAVDGPAAPEPDEPPNPPAVFVLAPPRSGTTLLRVMLGAHPALFAPPELELLSFRAMDERRAAFQGRDAFWLEGLIRAVMEARGVDAAAAERIVGEWERRGWTTRRATRQLQEWLGDRVLVDKTPSYALDPETLRRAEEGFAGARYLHLVRHPQATNRSFDEAKLDQIFFRRPHPFTRRQLAELVWTVSHRNILDFLADVPRERWMTVRFEELVREPDRVLADVCAFLGLEYQPEMADPYRPGSGRMVDGPHAVSRMLGDVKFLGHGRVDPAAAERWRGAGEVPLGAPARELARELGYADSPARGVLVPLQPGSPDRRPLFLVHPVGGEVIAYHDLARRLGPDQTVWGLQSPDPPLDDLREMAARYLDAVREVQPQGPYRLAGWSMGGVVAYEMARQLEERGEKTDLLALIDVASPARWAGEPEPSEGELAALFASDLAGLHGLAVPDLDLSALEADEALARVLDLGREAGLLPPGITQEEIRRLFDRFRANRRALSTYAPRAYAGEALLVRAAERVARLREGEDPTLGWSALIPEGLRVQDLPGDHYTVLREDLDTLIRWLW